MEVTEVKRFQLKHLQNEEPMTLESGDVGSLTPFFLAGPQALLS